MELSELDGITLCDYFFDRCDRETAERVERWFLLYGRTSEASAMMYSLWKELESQTDEESLEEIRAAFEVFRKRVSESERSSRKRRTGFPWWFGRVAAVLVLPLIGVSLYQASRYLSDTDTVWVEECIAPGQKGQITLSDGTEVWLNSGSRLIYPSDFSGRSRKVFFTGEGLFDVAYDSRRPFEISSGETLTKVLGTRFNLKSYSEDRNVELSLLEGSVSFVYRNSDGEDAECLLSPGEMLDYDKDTESVRKMSFSVADYSSWKDNRLYFRNMTLEEIARELERTFGVDIVIMNEALKSEPYYMAFVNDESIDDILEVIGRDERVKVVKTGTVIGIY